ncbi:unnamed protein product [Prunus brigantina]
MLLGDDIDESMEGTKVEFTLGAIDLDQPTAVLSQLNVWLNAEGKVVEREVQLRKRKRIIPMWKMVEARELVPKNLPETTRLRTLDPMKAIPRDDMVKLLKLCWEWRHNPNLVMQFGNVEAEIEFFASLVKADGWLKGDNVFTRTSAPEIGGVHGQYIVWMFHNRLISDCGMFVLKYIELLTAEIPLATCTAQNMPFFRLKLAAEIARGDAYMP